MKYSITTKEGDKIELCDINEVNVYDGSIFFMDDSGLKLMCKSDSCDLVQRMDIENLEEGVDIEMSISHTYLNMTGWRSTDFYTYTSGKYPEVEVILDHPLGGCKIRSNGRQSYCKNVEEFEKKLKKVSQFTIAQ